jgi:hypothetical protein
VKNSGLFLERDGLIHSGREFKRGDV